MNSFSSYLWKEYLEIMRSKRIFVFAAGILLFAMMDPIMLKLMPVIIKSQIGDLPIEQMGIKLDQFSAMSTFAGDLFEIGTLVIALSMMGITAGERNDRTLIIPRMAGLNLNGAVWAKFAVNTVVLTLLSVIGFIICFYYSSLLFKEGPTVEIANAVFSGLIFGFHFAFITALCIFFGSLFSKGIFVGILTLVTVYGLSALSGLLTKIADFLPSRILASAGSFKDYDKSFKSILILCAVIIILCLFSSQRLKKVLAK